jgi:hypothetical protein
VNLRKLILATALCTGCISPQDTFDDYVHLRRELAGDAGADSGATGNTTPLTPEQIEGTYLYAVSILLSPTNPVVYLVEVKAAAVPGSTDIEIMLRQRALSCTDRKTPVEEFSPWQTARVSATGAYTSDPVHTVVPASANAPLGCMSVGDSMVTFTGSIINPATAANPDAKVEFWCGDVTGLANGFLDLKGSTFTAVRVTDPENLPPVVINCAKQPAEPLAP